MSVWRPNQHRTPTFTRAWVACSVVWKSVSHAHPRNGCYPNTRRLRIIHASTRQGRVSTSIWGSCWEENMGLFLGGKSAALPSNPHMPTLRASSTQARYAIAWRSRHFGGPTHTRATSQRRGHRCSTPENRSSWTPYPPDDGLGPRRAAPSNQNTGRATMCCVAQSHQTCAACEGASPQWLTEGSRSLGWRLTP